MAQEISRSVTSLPPLGIPVPMRYSRAIPTEQRGYCGALDELHDELRRSERNMERLYEQAQNRIRGSDAQNLLHCPGHEREVETARTSCLWENQADPSCYVVSLDIRQFQAEHLKVKVVGHRLQVMGRHEVHDEDSQGGSSYRCLEFREEIKLPRDADPAAVSCRLTPEGKMRIEAPRSVRPAAPEPVVPIERVRGTSKSVEGAPGETKKCEESMVAFRVNEASPRGVLCTLT
uniref:heat shock protein 30-like n=1 Tax=Myxine glutinosa TaxID=7769 RepID=UPI00358F9714